MEQMLKEDLESDINAAKDKLRNIDEKVTTLSGRVPHPRISYDAEPDEVPLREVKRELFGLREPKISPKKSETQEGTRKRMDDRGDRRSGGRQSLDNNQKRPRPDFLDNEEDEEEFQKRQKRSMQSTVVMPALDSRGRVEKIEKLNETENKDSKQRNKRLFGNLLMGTLSQFKKTEKKTTQQEKQEEVEKRLEETKKKEFESRKEEKHELLNQRREHEQKLLALQRKRALVQYAETRIKQLETMKGSIKTTTSPHIFWQPVKSTPRTVELKLATERQLDEEIKERKDQLEKELEGSGGRQVSESRGDDKQEEEDEYEEEEDDMNENEDIEVVLKNEDDLKREAAEEDEDDIDVHVELD